MIINPYTIEDDTLVSIAFVEALRENIETYADADMLESVFEMLKLIETAKRLPTNEAGLRTILREYELSDVYYTSFHIPLPIQLITETAGVDKEGKPDIKKSIMNLSIQDVMQMFDYFDSLVEEITIEPADFFPAGENLFEKLYLTWLYNYNGSVPLSPSLKISFLYDYVVQSNGAILLKGSTIKELLGVNTAGAYYDDYYDYGGYHPYGDITTSYKPTKKKKQVIVLFNREVTEKIIALLAYNPGYEWGALMVGEKVIKTKKNKNTFIEELKQKSPFEIEKLDIKDIKKVSRAYIVNDIILVPQIRTTAHVTYNITHEKIAEARKRGLIGWIHSHHTMGAFHSATDNDNLKSMQLFAKNKEKLISVVVAYTKVNTTTYNTQKMFVWKKTVAENKTELELEFDVEVIDKEKVKLDYKVNYYYAMVPGITEKTFTSVFEKRIKELKEKHKDLQEELKKMEKEYERLALLEETAKFVAERIKKTGITLDTEVYHFIIETVAELLQHKKEAERLKSRLNLFHDRLNSIMKMLNGY